MYEEYLDRWKSPISYFGFNPVGDFFVMARTRDSRLLQNMNYDSMLGKLEKFNPKKVVVNEELTSGENNYVYDFRCSHWAEGWVEYICIRADAPEEILKEAFELLEHISYPGTAIDQEKFEEEFLWEQEKEWLNAGIDERIDWCKEAKISIFASRGDDLPEEVKPLIGTDI